MTYTQYIRPKTKLVGILFLWEITQARLAENPGPETIDPRHINTPPGVFVITTKWPDPSSTQQTQFDTTGKVQLARIFNLEFPAMNRFLNTPRTVQMHAG